MFLPDCGTIMGVKVHSKEEQFDKIFINECPLITFLESLYLKGYV